MNKLYLLLVFLLPTFIDIQGQVVAVKTNVLYDAITTPNIGAEVAFNKHWSVEASGYYNGWTFSSDKSFKHWMIQPEARYWIHERFNGHFFGVHAQYIDYDFAGLKLLYGMEKKNSYNGNAYGGGAYATSIFNAGASIGALIAPLSIPLLAKAWGWEMAFIVIGGLGFIWMGFWVFMYTAPAKSKHVNKAELEYIEQDSYEDAAQTTPQTEEKKMSFQQCFGYKQTWAFAIGKFMTDGVWWFFLFWTPSYLNTQFGIKTSDGLGIALIFTLYAITMLSIYGGKLPSIIIKKTGLNPYAARMRAMLIFAFFPLLVLLAQPLGTISPWFPVILIGIGGAAHQSWSANIFSTVGDMFPKTAIATVTGIGGMAGGIGCMVLQYIAGELFVYAGETNMTFMGFEGKPAGYFVIFCVCAVAYLIGWCIMKALVPKYKPIVLN